jgi:rSAM/selenodomain-associated transferase 2
MISVIVPVLNEESGIRACLESLLAWGDRLEIIVVDGGSQDATVEIVQSLPVGLVTALGGRGAQMNRGAAIAKGEILLFLHSDTQLPQTFITEIEAVLAQPQAIAGAFPLRIDDPRPSLRWIETFVQWRSQYLSLPYGDQAIFLKTSTFQQMGGYAPLPIMEDYELIQRLKKQGKIYLAQHPVITSSRRWRKLGVWRTTWINQLMLLGYHLKLDPQTLKQWYRQQAQ